MSSRLEASDASLTTGLAYCGASTMAGCRAWSPGLAHATAPRPWTSVVSTTVLVLPASCMKRISGNGTDGSRSRGT